MTRRAGFLIGTLGATMAAVTAGAFLVWPELAPRTPQPTSDLAAKSLLVPVAESRGDPFRRFGVEPTGPQEAPNFSLPTPEGRGLRLSDLRGQVVALNFWATWCIPCRTEMPAMERLYRRYQAQGFTVLGVNYQEPAKRVRAFMQELKLTFPTVIDPLGEVYEAYRIFALPTTYLIGRQGRFEGKIVGYRDWA
ncbi:MAG: TlpA family protein disulfide reductase, partial [Deltaproteobacteria bacterium]|nr:TlpA family protein disulfide reductase [Deltaproteobacteria bacterium]